MATISDVTSGPVGAAQAQTGTVLDRSYSADLDKDAFLKIMLAQLQHQDPLSPMENQEFISQLAQFNALEQQINLNDKFDEFMSFQRVSQAAQLIGRTIQVMTTEGVVKSAQVEQIIISKEGITLSTEIGLIPFDSVLSIY